MPIYDRARLEGTRRVRLLVVRTGAMGDVLHAMPAVAALRARHPEWEIGWAIEPRWLPLLRASAASEPGGYRGMPLVDKVHEVPTRAWNQRPFSRETLGEVWSLRRELREQRYDICVDMQGLLRSAVVGWMAGAELSVGYARPREEVARWLYGRRVAARSIHVVDRGLELMGAAVGEVLTPAMMLLPWNEKAEAWCDQLLTGLAGGARFALLAPTAGWGAKQWPVERYGGLAAALSERGFLPLVNAAREHDEVATAVREASGGRAVPVVCDMAQLVALVRWAAVVVAGDTGPLHLAAALDRPVVGLYGPTHPERTGPYAGRRIVIRHKSSRVDHRRHTEPEEGLARITVEEVVSAVEQVSNTSWRQPDEESGH